mgnify:CR=1 FL=1
MFVNIPEKDIPLVVICWFLWFIFWYFLYINYVKKKYPELYNKIAPAYAGGSDFSLKKQKARLDLWIEVFKPSYPQDSTYVFYARILAFTFLFVILFSFYFINSYLF